MTKRAALGRPLLFLTLVIGLLLTECTESQQATPSVEVSDEIQYRGSLALTTYRRTDVTSGPVAVLFHGCCGDAADMDQLAYALALRDMVVFNVSLTPFDRGGGWPTSFDDGACAMAYAAENAPGLGGDPQRLALVGWSDGALVASVNGLHTIDVQPDCVSSEPAEPETVVGLSGFYGYEEGSEVDPEEAAVLSGGEGWLAGDPHQYLATGNPIRSVLVAGTTDPLLERAYAWESALIEAGHSVELHVAPGSALDTISPRTPIGADVVDLIVEAMSSGSS